MPLGSKCATFEQWRFGRDAAKINILACLDIVQGIRDQGQILEEFIGEDVARAFVHLVQTCNHIALKFGVHVDCSSGSSLGLGLAQVLFTEEELSVQVADLNNVWVCQDNRTG